MAKPTGGSKPRFIPPMLATLVGGPFDDPYWLFEVKWDGFRVEAVVDGGGVRLWTRGEKDAAEWYFGPFLEPPTWIAATQAIVDGEVIALGARGEPDFALLQARIKGRGVAAEPTPFVYEVFDLLHLDGQSLLDEPLEERRRLLAGVLRPDPRVRLSEHIEADATADVHAVYDLGAGGGTVHWDMRGPVTFVDGDPPMLKFGKLTGTATVKVGGQTVTSPVEQPPLDSPLEVGSFCP